MLCKNYQILLITNALVIRPTEIIGDQSLNARKFVKSYISSSFVKRYLIKSFYGKRICHFVSSKYLIENILKIIEGDVLSREISCFARYREIKQFLLHLVKYWTQKFIKKDVYLKSLIFIFYLFIGSLKLYILY